MMRRDRPFTRSRFEQVSRLAPPILLRLALYRWRLYRNPLQIEVRKSLPFNGAFRPLCLSNKQLFLVHRGDTVLTTSGAVMQKRAAIYVRVSTDKQTVENQVTALRQIAERR